MEHNLLIVTWGMIFSYVLYKYLMYRISKLPSNFFHTKRGSLPLNNKPHYKKIALCPDCNNDLEIRRTQRKNALIYYCNLCHGWFFPSQLQEYHHG